MTETNFNGQNRPLTSQQQRFVEEYVKTLNAEQSVLKAGYSRERAARQCEEMLNNPRIIDEINRRAEQRTHRLNADRAFIVKKLLDIVNASTAYEEILDKSGTPTGRTRLVDTASALRALDALSKLCIQSEYFTNTSCTQPPILCIENLDNQKI